MSLSSLELKIVDYIESSNCGYLLDPAVVLFKSNMLPGQSYAFLKKLIKNNNSKGLQSSLIEYFEKYHIKYQKRDKYLNKHRQRKHRLKNKLLSKKQLNFYVDFDLYEDIQSLKSELNFNYSQLLSYLLENVKK